MNPVWCLHFVPWEMLPVFISDKNQQIKKKMQKRRVEMIYHRLKEPQNS